MPGNHTATIQVGNTDNRLTQSEWAHFIAYLKHAIEANCYCVHFYGGSEFDAPCQNVCWVVEVLPSQVELLRKAITDTRASWRQDSAAITFGTTEFI